MPAYIAAQILGCALAIAVIAALYPGVTPAEAADVIIPHVQDHAGPRGYAAYDGEAPEPARPGPPD